MTSTLSIDRATADDLPAPPLRSARAVLVDLFGPPAGRTFAVRLWDGSTDGPPPGQPSHFTLVLRRPGALRRMLLPRAMIGRLARARVGAAPSSGGCA